MNNFKIVFVAIAPLLIYVIIGKICSAVNILDKKTASGIDRLVYNAIMPLNLFYSIATTDISSSFNVGIVLFCIILLTVCVFVSDKIVHIFYKDKKVIPVMTQAMFRSNYSLFGLSVAQNFYGESNTSTICILISILVPLLNLYSIYIFEKEREDNVDLIHIIKRIIKNPLIIGSIIGIVFSLLRIQLPSLLMDTCKKISNMATPLAMISLGSTLVFTNTIGNKKEIEKVALFKLVVYALISVTLAVVIGYRNIDLLSILLFFGSPCAVSSYSLASEMKCDNELAGQTIVVTTLLSTFTLMLMMFVLLNMGMI